MIIGDIETTEKVEYEDLLKNYYEKMEIIEEQDKEIERLNKKIEQYENPEDMTLMFMWCDEKAKDEIKRLNNIINELEEEISKHIALCTDITLNDILDKLQELKGSNSNENL